jgi:ParB family chromosome partitioning protein
MNTPNENEKQGESYMTTATPNEQILGTLEHLHPDTVQIDDNVRTDAALTKPFIASIAEHGVLVPLTAIRTPDGVIHIRTGQRRTLAARKAGLTSIPVFIRDVDYHPGDPSDEQQAARLVEQIVENDRRLDLTATQRVFGIQQLLDTGMSVTKAAKKLSVSAPTVKAAKAVAGSQAALDALASDEHQLSLLEAAVIAEFEDNPRAMERLLNPQWQSFDHVAAQLREERASAQAQAEAEQRYRDEGYTVLTETPQSFDPFCVPLQMLLRADGEHADTTAVTVPAQWAVLVVEDQVLTDKETGEPVDEDDVDWNTEGRPDATPETREGETEPLRHADTVLETTGFGAEYFCLDYQAAGLTPTERFMRLGGVNRFATEAESESDGVAPASPDELAERRALAAAQAASEKEDADRRERRKVLALNKLGAAALEVRRAFIKKLLAGKTAPKGAAIFVARALASDSYLLTTNNASNVAAELLGLKDSGKKDGKASYEYAAPTDAVITAARGLPDTGDQRAQILTLGLVLGALEARTPKDAWRGGGGYSHMSRAVGGKEYLQFLADNGYQLAPVEEVIAGKKKADKVYDQHQADQQQ